MPHHKNLMRNENLPLTFVMGIYKAEGALKHNIFMEPRHKAQRTSNMWSK